VMKAVTVTSSDKSVTAIWAAAKKHFNLTVGDSYSNRQWRRYQCWAIENHQREKQQ